MAVMIVVAVLLVDQIIKLLVKTSMPLYDTIRITDWFRIHFIENAGMAWGMQLGPKIILSLFRLVAIGFLSYYIWLQSKTKVRWGYMVCLSMILAGAAGNLIDCMFYGLVFDESTMTHVSQFMGGGYAPFLMGKVVDMFYFPLIDTTLPSWLPIWGGKPFTFFDPVFNFADASISVGVVALLLFYRKELSKISLKPVNE
ncbi:MAG: lipoprotein signal peptidase [Prevotella sp.]|nr:lipoprotein signal peptidase [Prevotella sp.]